MEPQDFPALYAAADKTARSGELRYVGLTSADLVLVVAAALFGGLSALGSEHDARWFAAGAAACLVAALLVRFANRSTQPNREWWDGRAVAETVKSATWRYVARVGPFSGGDADKAFIDQLTDILDESRRQRAELQTTDDDAPQITETMQRLRALGANERRAVYLSDRVQDQIRWYSSRAKTHRQRASQWFWVGAAAQLVALAWAIARAAEPMALNFVAFFSSVAAGGTAIAQVGRHDELARSYSYAAQELNLFKSLLERAKDDVAFAHLVEQTELAISREHTLWVAKRT